MLTPQLPPTTTSQAAASLHVWKSFPTYHILDGALILSQVIFSQEGEHKALNAVNVQAHLNW